MKVAVSKTAYQKLKDEYNYSFKEEYLIENSKIENIPQLDSLTELTGGTIKEINTWFNRLEGIRQVSKWDKYLYYNNQ